jgi:hypothetical protein
MWRVSVMRRIRSSSQVLIAVALLASAGCTSVERDWEEARHQDTVAGYTAFLAKNPENPHVSEARNRIEDLEWQATAKANSCAAYQAYLRKYPAPAQLDRPWTSVILQPPVTVTRCTLRQWDSFDGVVPAGGAPIRWTVGDEPVPEKVFGGGDFLIRSVRKIVIDNTANRFTYSDGGIIFEKGGRTVFTMEVRPFAAGGAAPRERAAGRFWEITLFLENRGTETETIWFPIDPEQNLDLPLIAPGQPLRKPRAFRIPDLPVGNDCLLTRWTGKLGVHLNPGEATWLMAVFDVPPDTRFAVLSLPGAPVWIKP